MGVINECLDAGNLTYEGRINLLVTCHHSWRSGSPWLHNEHVKRLQRLTCNQELPSWFDARLHLLSHSVLLVDIAKHVATPGNSVPSTLQIFKGDSTFVIRIRLAL